MSSWLKATRPSAASGDAERVSLLHARPPAALSRARSGDVELRSVGAAQSYQDAGGDGGNAHARPALRAPGGGGGGDDDDDVESPSRGGARSASSYDTAEVYGGGKGSSSSSSSSAASSPPVGAPCGPARCCACFPCCARMSLATRWLLSVAITTLLLVACALGGYFAAPAIVKNRIAATTLSFSSIALSAPRWPSGLSGDGLAPPLHAGVDDDDPDGLFGFTITAAAVLAGLSPVGGTLEAMPVVLIFEGAPLAAFTLPSVSARAFSDNALALSAPATITDVAAFNRFGVALLQRAAVTFTLSGSATVRAGPVRIAGVPFLKEVTVAGAGNLAENYVSSFSLAGSTATAALVNLTVVAVNPSVAAIAPLGDLAVDVLYEGAYFGTVVARGAALAQGANAFTFVGELASANRSLTEQLISRYLGGAPVNVTAVGSRRVPPSSIPLYAGLLSALRLETTLLGGDVPLIAGVAVNSMVLAPVGLTAVRIDLNASIHVNNILGPDSPLRIESVMLNVTLEGGGQPLGRLVVDMPFADIGAPPAVAAADAAADAPLPVILIPLVLSAVLDIEETAADFSAFILAFLANETVTLGLVSAESNALRANISCALGNLSIGIPLDVVAVVAGLAGFPYVAVDAFAVVGEVAPPDAPAPAVLVTLNVSILNPSPAAFGLGERSVFGIYAGDVRLGESAALNCTLAPGINTLTLAGALAPPTAALPAASRLFSDYLNGVDSVVTVRGESVVLGGGQPTPVWLSEAVQSIALAAILPAAAGLRVFAEVELLELGLEWAPPPPPPNGSAGAGAGDDAVPYISGAVAGNIHLPFSIPVDIPRYSLELVLRDALTQQAMASVSLVDQAAAYVPALPIGGAAGAGEPNAPAVGRLTLALSRTPLRVLDAALLAAFISQALIEPSATIVLTGTAAPTVAIAIGNLSITNVTVAERIVTPGMNGLSAPPPEVLSVDVLATTATSVTLGVVLNVTNPSIVAGVLGPVALTLAYAGIPVARVTVPNLRVARGANTVAAAGVFTLPDRAAEPAAYAAATAFLSGYLSGRDTDALRLLGDAAASPYPLLQPAFARLNTSCPFPGLARRIIDNGTLYVDLSNPLFNPPPPRPNGTLFLRNPLSAPIVLRNASLTVFLCTNATPDGRDCFNPAYNDPIGFFYDGDDLATRPAVAAPNAVSRSRVYPIKLLSQDNVGVQLFVLIEFAARGYLVTKLNGTVGVLVGDFAIDLFLEQRALPLYDALPADTPPWT